MRPPRNYQAHQIYLITQRGNQGQWVLADTEDFEMSVVLMRRYAPRHQVNIIGWKLLHNEAQWILEAGTTSSISNLMRDMQSRYSHYLNVKYRDTPWKLIAPLYGMRNVDHFSPHLKMGPVNWTPRHHALLIEPANLAHALRQLENSPVLTGIVPRAVDWRWSSALAHTTGKDLDQVLSFERWLTLFGCPETMARGWQRYLEERSSAWTPSGKTKLDLGTGCPHNRPKLIPYMTAPPGT